MIAINKFLKLKEPSILLLGDHPGIIQSILDFDWLAGKPTPSVIGVVGTRRRQLRYFWGNKEFHLPGFVSLETLDAATSKKVDLFAIAQSGRRAALVSEEALRKLPKALGGMIFAEGVPEQHAIRLRKTAQELDKFILGPASVGAVIGGACKLGAIGGTLPEQIVQAGILNPGKVAVISTSGGMINELITMIAARGSGISFAAAVGGERYPITKPAELVSQALADKSTKAIVYFGELGGNDEHEIAALLKKSKKTKPFIAYIAGSFAEKFETAPQFGHAKALAQDKSETASAKKKALRQSGAYVADSFAKFETKLAKLPKVPQNNHPGFRTEERLETLASRTPSLFVSRISSDKGGEVKILGTPLLKFVSNRSLSEIALSMFLGQKPKSAEFVEFFDMSLRLLVDHGPQVSGVVNTMITARAGKDLSASLASGILTIGPRFGGAVNQAAQSWFEAVNSRQSPESFVESYAKNKTYIAGIGHRKYHLDNPDPRVALLLSKFDKGGPHTTFAKQVERITTRKKSGLILNVDGAIAALLLDLLANQEKYSRTRIEQLLKTDFCNAIFVMARSIGLIAHHLEQQRLDERLFRLPDELIESLD